MNRKRLKGMVTVVLGILALASIVQLANLRFSLIEDLVVVRCKLHNDTKQSFLATPLIGERALTKEEQQLFKTDPEQFFRQHPEYTFSVRSQYRAFKQPTWISSQHTDHRIAGASSLQVYINLELLREHAELWLLETPHGDAYYVVGRGATISSEKLHKAPAFLQAYKQQQKINFRHTLPWMYISLFLVFAFPYLFYRSLRAYAHFYLSADTQPTAATSLHYQSNLKES